MSWSHVRARQKELRTELNSAREGRRKLVTQRKLLFVLELKWNFALLFRNLSDTGLRIFL